MVRATLPTIGFVFLTAVTHFRIQDKWGLFLAGALFGWLAEGVLVQTTYEELPLSLSFTGLAWHALLTIWLGWYWLPQSLRQKSVWQVVRRAGATGILFGLWLLMWQVEVHPAQPPTPSSFVWFALFSSVGLGVSYWLLHWLEGGHFQVSRWEFTAIAGLLLLYFAIQTVPAAPGGAGGAAPAFAVVNCAAQKSQARRRPFTAGRNRWPAGAAQRVGPGGAACQCYCHLFGCNLVTDTALQPLRPVCRHNSAGFYFAGNVNC
jgi:hypothetical protein